ncbi:MAG TPA: MBL fold metallo-hydrolase [Spirochaetales bacterium]|nr:MBL fold metallo-hydrolase [Spirochaetales bacterium]HRV28575.1 MBL fold metallo-hydrolase [Spirochaetia bacterium]
MKLYFHYSLYGFSNVYLLANDETKEAIIIDPAEFDTNLLNFIEKYNYSITGVLITHNHKHHIQGLKTLIKIYPAKIYASSLIDETIQSIQVNDNDEFFLCGFNIKAFSIPGHSPDSLVYYTNNLLFTGDTIQAGFIGSTLSQYSLTLLKENISEKILNQNDMCIILPGHGPPTTIGVEKLYNLGFRKKTIKPDSGKYDLFID